MKKNKSKKSLKGLLEQNKIEILDIPCLKNEHWVKLESVIYPEIKDYYYISNKNRVFSMKSNKFLKIKHLDPDIYESPYHNVSLQCIENNVSFSKKFPMHRLMMSVFHPTTDMHERVVNHLDGNKLNNDLDNMEWSDYKGNAEHARDNGLLHPVYGEKHCCAKISEEDALNIITLLLEGDKLNTEISREMGVPVSIIDSIRSKKAWKHLTKNIDFSKVDKRLSDKLTNDQIREICTFFENNPRSDNESIRKYCKRVIKSLNLFNGDTSNINVDFIRNILRRRLFTIISVNYNF